MSGRFIDSNIFLYLFDNSNDRKRAIANSVVVDALETGSGIISWQVVQEVLNVTTTKLDPPMNVADSRRLLESILMPLWRIAPSQPIYASCLEIRSRFGFAFYDSLIIASALEGGCSHLVSEDMQHGQTIDGMLIENPFR